MSLALPSSPADTASPLCSFQAVPASTRDAIAAPGPADQQFRAGPDQSLDGECPAVRVRGGEVAQQEPFVDRPGGGGLEIVGQHDLLQLAGPDPGGRGGHRGGEPGHREVGVGVADPARRADRTASPPAVELGFAGSSPILVTNDCPTGPAHHDLRHDRHRDVVVVEARGRRRRSVHCPAARPGRRPGYRR